MPSVRNILFSAVHFWIVAALFFISGYFIALGCKEHLRAILIEKLTKTPEFFLTIGLLILGVSLFLICAFYLLNKRPFFQVVMGSKNNVDVDVSVIAALSRDYFSKLFPQKEIPLDVVIHRKSKIELIVAFPECSKTLLQQVEQDLSSVFAKTLNYNIPFILTIT